MGWSLILLGVFGVLWVAVRLYRKSARDAARFQAALDDNRVEMSGLASRNIAEDRWEAGIQANAASMGPRETALRTGLGGSYAPAYIPPAPRVYSPPVAPSVSSSTVVVNQGGGSGGNDLVTGMVLGEMMSDRRREPVIREREVVYEREATRPSYGGSSNYDAGGGSSSYSTPSTSTSSSDSGGSSSWSDSSSTSYDSGSSSSDSSSSSSDSGGGSSDW